MTTRTILPLFILAAASTLSGCNLDLDRLFNRILPPDECAQRSCQQVSGNDCFRDGNNLVCPGIEGCVEFEGQCWDSSEPTNPESKPPSEKPPVEQCDCEALFGTEVGFEAQRSHEYGYEDYPDYEEYPEYPDYEEYPEYPDYEEYPEYPDYEEYPEYPDYEACYDICLGSMPSGFDSANGGA